MLSCNAADRTDGPLNNNVQAAGQENLAPDSLPQGKLIPLIACRADTTESYALYMPAHKRGALLPVVCFFDPHADGAGTLKRYTSLADHYGFILVASNNSRNGNDWPTEEHIWNCISNDTRNRLPIDSQRIYTCGFSGGAKAAIYLAMRQSIISGVIACGAILPDMLQQNNLPYSFTAITGEGDMNRSDIIAANNDLDKTGADHRLLFFNGIHEWPPLPVMDKAFAALAFDAMRKNKIPADSSFIKPFINLNKKEADSLIAAHNLLRAAATCHFAFTVLNGIDAEAGLFLQKEKAITASPNWKQQMDAAVKEQQQEQLIKGIYQQQFQQGDQQYWTSTINNILSKAKTTGPETAMYQRLKAYLSLAFYSISNQCISSNQNAAAAHFISLYKLVDEANSEAWYFSAIINARNGNLAQASTDIIKAVALGFNDKARLMQQAEFKQAPFKHYRDEALAKIK